MSITIHESENKNSLINTIANSIAFFRKKMSLTQAEMAQHLGISHRYYQTIESGRSEIKVSTLEAIGHKLNIDTSAFLQNPKFDPLSNINFFSKENILDALHVSVMVTDKMGKILYINKFFKDSYCFANHQNKTEIYSWDFQYEPQDPVVTKERLSYLIKQMPTPVPRYDKYKKNGGGYLPVKIDWNYLRNDKQDLIGFIMIISNHPSW